MEKKRKHVFLAFVILLMTAAVSPLLAQNALDLRFNEVLVHNEMNYTDGYGVRSPWLEIVNTSYSYVDIGRCYLTNDPENNPRMYWIPDNTPQTIIPPRGYVVFYAYNNPTRGIFHLNFDLRKSDVIALFDANGRTLIDKLDIRHNEHKTDIAYARVHPDKNEWIFQNQTTPGTDNDYSRKVTAGEEFVEMDPVGAGMTFIAMFVVFLALIILYVIFRSTGRFFTRTKPVQSKQGEDVAPMKAATSVTGEANAAIAMSVYLFTNEIHDFENTVLTIKKVSRTYSPWSSKIYAIRRLPRQ